MTPDQRLSRREACAFACLVAGCTLALQVLAHRVVSAKLLNNLAFLVIALTMLGFALSGVLLSGRLEEVQRRLRDRAGRWAAGAAATMLAVTLALYRVDPGPQLAYTRQEFVVSFLTVIPIALLLAVPFTFCGLVLGALLAAPGVDARRVYGFDLLGSAVGAVAVVPLIAALGVESAVGLVCAALVAGAAVVARPRGRMRALLALCAAASLLVAAGGEHVLRMRYPRGSLLEQLADAPPPYGIERVRWDPLARIEVSRITPPDPDAHFYPCLIGSNRAFHRRFERIITQNNYAFTYALTWDGRPASLEGIEETIYAAAYRTTSVARPRAAVIGVGGGFDLLTALAHDPAEVTGVEVNGATLRLLQRDYAELFGPWTRDPRVRLVHDDGRHFLAASDARYDVIQLSGVDTFAGTPAAAHVFSESYLYTAEAFDLYLSRLTDQGILNVMRVEMGPPREMLKALVTAIDALRRRGVADPARHLLVITSAPTPNFVAVLVKLTPFTPDEVARARAYTRASPYLRLSAGAGGDDGGREFSMALAQSPVGLREWVAAYPFAVAAATDERPFFFRHSFWWHVLPSDELVQKTSLPAMEYSLLLLGALIGVATVACAAWPLRRLAARGVVRPGTWRDLLYFAGAGLGYMAVEMAFLQRIGLLLGHPNHALSLVLASLLLFTGVGSLAAPWVAGRVRLVSVLLVGLLLFEHAVALPALPRAAAWSFGARAALAVALIAPVGVCLGVFLPTGIEALKRESPAHIPWAWGVNGIASVLAPVACVAVAQSWGIGAVLLAGAAIYAGVGALAHGQLIGRRS